MTHPAILLASNSPRRRQLLSLTGWTFRVRPVDIDESPLEGEFPGPYVLRLAKGKALAAVPIASQEEIVVAADTIVVDGNHLLGKPDGKSGAISMLKRLRGRTHQVYSALAIIKPGQENIITDVCVSQVPMRNYSDEEIEDYVASGDPMDKAGAYAIQNQLFHPVKNFLGCQAGVMGLPLCHLVRSLRKIGIEPGEDVPQRCQADLNYSCPIYQAVRRGENMG